MHQAETRAVSQRVLVAEDLEDARVSLQQLLHLSLDLEVDVAEDGQKALHMLEQRPYSILVTDLRMPKLGGLKLMEAINERRLPVTVIVTTGHGGVEEAVQAMRMGAYDFLTKPADPQHLVLMVQRALRERALQDEVAALRAGIAGPTFISKCAQQKPADDGGVRPHHASRRLAVDGSDHRRNRHRQRAGRTSDSHFVRAARTAPFVAVNCGALNENLLESELFGHEKGSFTGAAGQRKGRFEMANGGTLFLDEIGDVPMSMQVRLLRVLQDRRFERVGGTEPIETDVRVIAATHRNLDALIQEGKFRDDLYYRLNVIRIELPPLRERPEDIRLLAAHFCQKFARPGHPPAEISPEAMEVLLRCQWPGNVRQLENAIERACVTATRRSHPAAEPACRCRAAVGRQAVPSKSICRASLPEQLTELTATFEERVSPSRLRKTRGHVGKCAKLSGLSRRSITDKIAHYKIDKTVFKKDED